MTDKLVSIGHYNFFISQCQIDLSLIQETLLFKSVSSINKARATLESLGAQDTSRTFKEFKGFYKIPTAQVPGQPKIPKDSKEFKRTPKNFNCSSPRPTYRFRRILKNSSGSQRIPKDSEGFRRIPECLATIILSPKSRYKNQERYFSSS